MALVKLSEAAGLRLLALTLATATLATAPACNGGGGTQPTPLPSATRPPTARPKSPTPTPVRPTDPPATPTPTPRGPELRGRVRADALWLKNNGLADLQGAGSPLAAMRMRIRGTGVRIDGAYVPLPGLASAAFSQLMSQTLGGLGGQDRYALAQANPDGRVLPVAGLVVAAFKLATGELVRPTDGRSPWTITGADGSFALPMPDGDPGPLLLVARPASTEDGTGGLNPSGTLVAAGGGNLTTNSFRLQGAEALLLPNGADPARLAFGAIVRVGGREIVIDEETRVLTGFLRDAAASAALALWQADPAARAQLLRVPAAARAALLKRAGGLVLATAELDSAQVVASAGASPGPATAAFGASLAGLRSVAAKALEAQPSLLTQSPWPQATASPDPSVIPAPDASYFPGYPLAPNAIDVLDLVVGTWIATDAATGAAATQAMTGLGLAGRSDGKPVALAPLAAAAEVLRDAVSVAARAEASALQALLDAAAGPVPTPTPIKLGGTPRPSPPVP